MTSLTRTP